MTDEILSVIQTLYNHRHIIHDACKLSDGMIIDNDENATAIRALKRHGLIWQMSDSYEISLSRPVLNLLRRAQQRRNRRITFGNVDRLWEDVCERLEDYSDLMKVGKIRDLDNIEGDIRDGLHELADTISQDIRTFTEYIDHGFAYIHDLELRVKQNQRAIQRAKQLNTCLQSIHVHEALSNVRLNAPLRHLLLGGFAVAIALSRRELLNTIHRLNELLVVLRKDSELNQLIRAFELTFKNQPEFSPVIPPLLEHVPPVLARAAPVIRPTSTPVSESSFHPLLGDIYSPEQTPRLADMVAKLRPEGVNKDTSTEETLSTVSDLRNETLPEITDHPVVAAARQLIQAAPAIKRPLSLIESHQKLNIDCPTHIWMTTVLNVLSAIPEHEFRKYQLTYDEKKDPRYSGNHTVRDVKIFYKP